MKTIGQDDTTGNSVEIPCGLKGKIGLICRQLLYNLYATDIF